MKNLQLLTIPTLILILLTIPSCNIQNLIEDLGNDIDINLNTDIFRVPLLINFVDANPEFELGNTDLNLRIEGPDKDIIFSSTGERNLKVEGGFLEIAVDKFQEINEENPLELTIITEADGYHHSVNNIAIYDTSLHEETISLLSTEHLPEGLSMHKEEFMVSPAGSTREITFSSPMDGMKQEASKVTINPGTKFFTESGQAVSGMIEAEVIHYDSRSEASLDVFPGGLMPNSVLDMDGNEIGPLQFEPVGVVQLEIKRNKDKVKTFSQPVEVEVGVNPDAYNPDTEEIVKEGDMVPVWSHDDDTGQWTQEGMAPIKKNADGQLTASYGLNHLSHWHWGWFYRYRRRGCFRTRANVTIQGSPQSGPNSYRYYPVQFVDANSGRRYGRRSYIWFRNGQLFRYYNVPSGRTVKFQILEDNRTSYCRPGFGTSNVLYETTFTSSCTSNLTVDASNIVLPSKPITNIVLSGTCSNSGGSDFHIFPSIYLYYRESGCYRYTYLGGGRQGRVSSRYLELNKAYDFYAIIGGQAFSIREAMIQASQTVLDNGRLTITANSDQVDIVVDQVLIPKVFCDQLLNR